MEGSRTGPLCRSRTQELEGTACLEPKKLSPPNTKPLSGDGSQYQKITWTALTGENMKLSPSSKDNFASGLFTLWLGPQQKLPVTLQESLMAISPSWDTFLSIIINRPCYLFSYLSLCLLVVLLQFYAACCKYAEEIGRSHLALRVNDKSNNSMTSFVISNTVLWQ